MDRKQFDDLMFYCWQLKIRTIAELEWFKCLVKAKSNQDLLNKMAYTYNKGV